MRITISGLKDVNARLKQLGDSLEARKMKQVLVEGVDVIRAEALLNLGQVTKKKSGDLEHSLITRPGKSDTYASAYTKSQHKVAPYAQLVEFGHRGPLPSSPHTPPHPFFRPALDHKRSLVRRIVVEGIKDLLTGKLRFQGSPQIGGEFD